MTRSQPVRSLASLLALVACAHVTPARAAIAAWADRLGEEALGTLSSWSGRMTVPPVVFKPPAAQEPTLKTALAAPPALKD